MFARQNWMCMIVFQADLEEKLEEEQKLTTGAAGILTTMETSTELVGDGSALKEPGTNIVQF